MAAVRQALPGSLRSRFAKLTQPVHQTSTVEVGNAGFNLTSIGQYKKNGFIAIAPDDDPMQLKPAIKMEGQANVKTGSPGVFKMAWGFIQRASATRTTKHAYDMHTFAANSPAGTKVTFPESYTAQDIPSAILVNDAPKGAKLYADHNPFALGFPNNQEDTPSVGAEIRLPWAASDGRSASILWTIKQNHVHNYSMTTWLVVRNRATGQWVPVRQRNWALQWDTSQAGPWMATPAAAETTPLTQPPSTTDSVGDYKLPEGSATTLTKTKP